MLYQLDQKLHNQLIPVASSSSSSSSCAFTTIHSVLSSIERTIVGFYHRSRIKQPHHQLLPLLHIPVLAELAAEKQPIYGDINQHCNPLPFHKQRETHAHAFASASSSPRHPLPALLQPRPLLLIGRLDQHPSDPTRLLLVDDTASVPCHIVHADAGMLHRTVLFLHFNLVFPVGVTAGVSGVLEIDGADAVVLDEAPAVDLSALCPLPLHQMDAPQIRRLYKASSSSSSSQSSSISASSASAALSSSASSIASSLSSSSAASSSSSSSRSSSLTVCHLRGHVSALSPLMQQAEQHFFFVELRDSRAPAAPPSASHAAPLLPSAHSTFIVFQGAAVMGWYHCLHVDDEYLFTHLRPKGFKLRDGRVQLLFACTPSQSQAAVPRVISAASCELPAFPPLPIASAPAVQQSQPVSAACNWSRTVDYVGTITAQVCAGVYELDHNAVSARKGQPSLPPSASTSAPKPPPSLRLFVIRYAPIVQDGALLRVGCVVRLHHVHPLVHSVRFLGFGCCSRSHIAVEQLSPFAEVCKPYDSAASAALCRQLSRLSLSDAALYLSMIETLTRKWSHRVKADLVSGASGPGLIHQLLPAYVKPQHQSDIYAEVMEHGSCSSAVPGSTATDGFPTFPSYSSLFSLPAVSAAYESLCHRINSSDHSTTAWHAACIPSSRLLPPGWFVTGYLSHAALPFHPRTFSIPASSDATTYIDAAPAHRPPVGSVCTGLQLRESLRDKAEVIDCQVRGALSGEHCGVLYHILSFQLVLETIPPAVTSSSGPSPPTASAASATPSIVAYLSFSIADAVPLITPRVSRPPSTSVFTSQKTYTSVLLYVTQKSSRVSLASPPSGLFLVPHHDLPTSCSSSSAVSHGHECTLRGLLVSSNVQSPSWLLVHLRPPVLGLSAVVHVGDVIELSSCRAMLNSPSLNVSEVLATTEECSVRVDRSAAASEWKLAVSSHLPPSHTFAQLLTVDMDEWLDSAEARKAAFSFSGVIVDKQVRADGFEQRSRLSRPRRSNSAPQHSLLAAALPAATDLSKAGMSLQWPLSGKLFLRVRDELSAQMVDVYVPLGERIYPAGLLPGAVVSFSDAVRKLSPSWKVYMECNASTDIHVLSPHPAPSSASHSFAFSAAVPAPLQPLPPSLLSVFTPCPVAVAQHVHRLRCRVHAVKRLSFAVHCLRCALPLPPASERRQHKSPCGAGGCVRVEFRANAYVQVDDGSQAALVVADGDVVWRLLALSRQEWDEVKRYVGQWGQLDYESSLHQQQAQQQHEQRGWRMNKRRREEKQRDTDDDMEDVGVHDARHGQSMADEPDIAAMQRERLFSLFRSKPRLRLFALHCQQLFFTKDIDAFVERRRRRQDGDASARERESAALRGMEALLASAVSHDFALGGVQLTTSKPAGVVMLRALECEEVDVREEARNLLRRQQQQQPIGK